MTKIAESLRPGLSYLMWTSIYQRINSQTGSGQCKSDTYGVRKVWTYLMRQFDGCAEN